eukprot:g1525.t1
MSTAASGRLEVHSILDAYRLWVFDLRTSRSNMAAQIEREVKLSARFRHLLGLVLSLVDHKVRTVVHEAWSKTKDKALTRHQFRRFYEVTHFEDGRGDGEASGDRFDQIRPIMGTAWDELRRIWFHRTPGSILDVLTRKRSGFDDLFNKFCLLSDRDGGLKEYGIDLDGFIEGLFVLGYSYRNMGHQLLVFRNWLKLKRIREDAGVSAIDFRAICLLLCTPYHELSFPAHDIKDPYDEHRENLKRIIFSQGRSVDDKEIDEQCKMHHMLTAAEFRQRMSFLFDQARGRGKDDRLDWRFFWTTFFSATFFPIAITAQFLYRTVWRQISFAIFGRDHRNNNGGGGGGGGSGSRMRRQASSGIDMVEGMGGSTGCCRGRCTMSSASLFTALLVYCLVLVPVVAAVWDVSRSDKPTQLPCTTMFEANFPAVSAFLLLVALLQFRAYNALPIHQGVFHKKQLWANMRDLKAKLRRFKDGLEDSQDAAQILMKTLNSNEELGDIVSVRSGILSINKLPFGLVRMARCECAVCHEYNNDGIGDDEDNNGHDEGRGGTLIHWILEVFSDGRKRDNDGDNSDGQMRTYTARPLAQTVQVRGARRASAAGVDEMGKDKALKDVDRVWGDRLPFYMTLSSPSNVIAWSKMRLYLLKILALGGEIFVKMSESCKIPVFQNTFDEGLTTALIMFVATVLGVPMIVIIGFVVAINELLRADLGRLRRQEYMLQVAESELDGKARQKKGEAPRRRTQERVQELQETRRLLRALIDLMKANDGRLTLFGLAPDQSTIYSLLAVGITSLATPAAKALVAPTG